MTIDIDNLTGTESLEDLEALLATVENDDDNSGNADTEGKGVEQPASPAAESEQASSESQTDDKEKGNTEQSQEEGEKFVASKDGAHKIPYAVLEHERAEAKRLREENELLRQAAADAWDVVYPHVGFPVLALLFPGKWWPVVIESVAPVRLIPLFSVINPNLPELVAQYGVEFLAQLLLYARLHTFPSRAANMASASAYAR